MTPPVKATDTLARRFTYHPPQGDQPDRYEQIRRYALHFAQLVVEYAPASDERIQALNSIDQAVMWANAAIARHE